MKHIITFLFSWLLASLPLISHAGKLSITAENDTIFHDDADYTHGTRIEYIQDDGLRYGVSQQIYTPLGLINKDQVQGRHPYAGTLVGFLGGRCVQPEFKHISVYNDLEFQIGVLGPSSQAEHTQRIVHKILDCNDPKGWDHQLHDELILQSVYWHGYDIRLLGRNYGWNIRWRTELGGLLGTLQVAPGINSDIKLGYGFGASEIDHEMHVRSVRSATRKPNYQIYGLAGCEGRWWLRNELLDGNAHYIGNSDTLTVDKEEFTGCAKLGIGAKYQRLDIRFIWIWCTREYKTQETTPNYGSITISWEL